MGCSKELEEFYVSYVIKSLKEYDSVPSVDVHLLARYVFRRFYKLSIHTNNDFECKVVLNSIDDFVKECFPYVLAFALMIDSKLRIDGLDA